MYDIQVDNKDGLDEHFESQNIPRAQETFQFHEDYEESLKESNESHNIQHEFPPSFWEQSLSIGNEISRNQNSQ